VPKKIQNQKSTTKNNHQATPVTNDNGYKKNNKVPILANDVEIKNARMLSWNKDLFAKTSAYTTPTTLKNGNIKVPASKRAGYTTKNNVDSHVSFRQLKTQINNQVGICCCSSATQK